MANLHLEVKTPALGQSLKFRTSGQIDYKEVYRKNYNGLVVPSKGLAPAKQSLIVVQPWWEQQGDVDCGVFTYITFLYLLKRSHYDNAVREPMDHSKLHCFLPTQTTCGNLPFPDQLDLSYKVKVYLARWEIYKAINLFWNSEEYKNGVYLSDSEKCWLTICRPGMIN